MSHPGPFLKIPVTTEQDDALREAARQAGYKSVSEYIRSIFAECVPGFANVPGLNRRGTYDRKKNE